MDRVQPAAARRLAIEDVDTWQTMARQVGWDAEYTQLDAGTLDGHFSYSVTENLRVGSPYTDKTILIRGAPPVDCCALVLPLTSGSKGIFQGQELGLGQAGIMCPNAESHYRTASPNAFISVSIPVPRLLPILEDVEHCSIKPLLTENRIVQMDEQQVAQLRHLLQQVIALEAHAEVPAYSALQLAEIEQGLVTGLALALTEQPEDKCRSTARRLQVVERAREYIDANLAEPLGLEVLALEAGASLRTLRYSFQHVLGINPLQYVKQRRLVAARKLMQKGHPGEISVIAVALACGFTHLSYFARDYRFTFGELPKETLARPALQS